MSDYQLGLLLHLQGRWTEARDHLELAVGRGPLRRTDRPPAGYMAEVQDAGKPADVTGYR